MGTDPVRQPLGPCGLGVGVIGGPQYRDKDLRPADLSGGAVDDRRGLASIIHKQLLAGPVVLAHDHIQLALPGAEVIAEPAVLVAIRMGPTVFLPEQEQGDMLVFELLVDNQPVGNASDLSRQVRWWRVLSGALPGWQLCRGISGSIRVEWVAGFVWNQWQAWPGIRSLHMFSNEFGDADKILDYFGGSPCTHTKSAFGR